MKLNSLLKSLGTYTIFNFINSLIPFLLLPVLTKYLSTSEYGVLDIFQNLFFLLSPIVLFSLPSSVLRFYFEKKEKEMSNIISTILVISFFSSLFFLTLSLFPFLFDKLSLFDYELPKGFIFYAVLHAVNSQFVEVQLALYRAKEKALSFGLLRISKTGLDICLSLIFVISLGYNWEGRVYGLLIVGTIYSILSIYLLLKTLDFKLPVFYKKEFNSMLKYSSPLILHVLSANIISYSDRFIILKFLGAESVGLYAVAYQIGLIMSFLNNSFNQAWTPFFFKKMKEGNEKDLKKIYNFNYIYFAIMLFSAFLIFFLTPYIYKYLIGESFKINFIIVLWVLLGYAFHGMYKMKVNYLFYGMKTKIIAYYTIISGVVNIILCYILVPVMGIEGAALSTAIAFLVLFLITYYSSEKYYKTKKIF